MLTIIHIDMHTYTFTMPQMVLALVQDYNGKRSWRREAQPQPHSVPAAQRTCSYMTGRQLHFLIRSLCLFHMPQPRSKSAMFHFSYFRASGPADIRLDLREKRNQLSLG